ncbi:MAG TPA: HAD hydrolase family protein [Acidobacteriota bacterium]|nr:HAD hydrolase family protein [Acidobacteriota bacterium]
MTAGAGARAPRADRGADARIVVVSDLDGTILRHEDYDATAALPAVALLRERGIPIVLASSKTRSEVEAIRAALGVFDPFIVENGGALLWPVGCDPPPPPGTVAAGPYGRIVYGTPYAELREALPRVGEALGVRLLGFGDVSSETVAEWTGLVGDALQRSLRREYDEPFLPERPLSAAEEAALVKAAALLGLRVTRGGRFHHLLGASDKARATRDVRRGYERDGGPVWLVAAGDGANDLDLLLEADAPIVVARPDGTHTPALVAAVPHARFTRGIGPAGFAEAISEIVLGARAGAAAGRPAPP